MSTTAAKTNETVKSRMSTRDIVLIGMFAALLAAFSQISLPMPTGVPITIQAFGVALVGVVLGWKPVSYTHLPRASVCDSIIEALAENVTWVSKIF